MDREQITHSIRSIYGLNMDAEGYLRRFIDFSFRLPQPSTETFAIYLSNRFNLEEVYEKSGDYSLRTRLINTFAKLSGLFHLSLRTQEQCFTEMNVVLRTSPNLNFFPTVLAFLITLKAYSSVLYEKLHSEFLDIDELLGLFRNSKNGVAFLNKDGLEIEAALMIDYLPEDELRKKITAYKEIASDGTNPNHKRMYNLVENILPFTRRNEIKSLIARIDIAQEFRPISNK